jgi:outer membrane protein assembly factor BamB
MYRHDPQLTGRSPYRGPRKGRIRWRYKPGGSIQSAITIGPDSTIYFGFVYEGPSQATSLHAVSPQGIKKWRAPVGVGPESQPLVTADGTIFIGGSFLYAIGPDGAVRDSVALTNDHVSPFINIGLDGTIYIEAEGHMVAVDQRGTVVWRVIHGTHMVTHNFPISPDGRLLYVVGGPFPQDTLYALHTSSGSIEWKFPFPSPAGHTFTAHPVTSSEGTVYFGIGHTPLLPPPIVKQYGMYALDVAGKLLWCYDDEPVSEVAIDGNGRVCFSAAQRRVLSLDCSGVVNWQASAPEMLFNPVCDKEGVAYFCSLRGLYGYDRRGRLLWFVPFEGHVTRVSPPAIGYDGTLYVGTFNRPLTDGTLYAIE